MTRSRFRPSARAVALAGVALGLACGGDPVTPRHVLLISIDTLRADHLGCYGYDRPTSPVLDWLASESIVFENAWSTAPWTLPAHGSLLTGLYPSRHGAREKSRALRSEVQTLAERLRDRGFATGAIVNVLFLGKAYGFDRGFDHYRYVPATQQPSGAASTIGARGLEWLETLGGQRSFLFLHYFDPHSDYVSQPRFRRIFTGAGPRGGSTAELVDLAARGQRLEPARLEHLVGLYDAGIRQLDTELGGLFARLQELGRFEETLIVVTSDHGEEFQDHGSFLHGDTHYEEMLRVPLIVRVPGGPRAIRIREPTSLVDVVPTILSLLGLEAAPDLDGVDLSHAWHGGALDPQRPIHAETGPRMGDRLRSVRIGDFKLVVDPDRARPLLFDLSRDPLERRDVGAEHPEQTARLERALRARDRLSKAMGPELGLSAESIEQLRALGYGTAPGSSPQPH